MVDRGATSCGTSGALYALIARHHHSPGTAITCDAAAAPARRHSSTIAPAAHSVPRRISATNRATGAVQPEDRLRAAAFRQHCRGGLRSADRRQCRLCSAGINDPRRLGWHSLMSRVACMSGIMASAVCNSVALYIQ